MAVKDYSTTPDLNVQISGINIAEGCPPSGINNAIRQLMADVKAEKDERDTAQAAKDAAQDAAIAEAKSSADEKALSFEVDGLDLVITYGNGTTKRVKLPTGKGVGDMWWGIDPNSKPANVQLYSGQLLSRSAYPDHWGVVNGQRTVLSESEWQAQVSANGFCPFYSSGDGSTTYRMPMVKGVHPKFVAALAEAGQYTKAGAPNITGDISEYRLSTGGLNGTSGAFGSFIQGSSGGPDYTNGANNICFNFNASRCSSVYRDDCKTIQPPAVSVILGEYVVGSVAVVGEADAESLLASVTQLESNVGALEGGVGRAKAYIIETWASGTEWYRKWSDGWIEQGGTVQYSSGWKVQTFQVPFSNNQYTITTSAQHSTIDHSGNSFQTPFTLVKTASGANFKFAIYAGNSGCTLGWYACGY